MHYSWADRKPDTTGDTATTPLLRRAGPVATLAMTSSWRGGRATVLGHGRAARSWYASWPSD